MSSLNISIVSRVNIQDALDRAGADPHAPEGSHAWTLAQVSDAAVRMERDAARLDWLEQNGCQQFQGPYWNAPEGAGHRWFDTDTSGSDYSKSLRDAVDAAIDASGGAK